MGSYLNERINFSCNEQFEKGVKHLLDCCGANFKIQRYLENEIGIVYSDFNPVIGAYYKPQIFSLDELFLLVNELFENVYLYYELEEGSTVSDAYHRNEIIFDPKKMTKRIADVKYCYGDYTVRGKNPYEILKNKIELQAKKKNIEVVWHEGEIYPIGDEFDSLCNEVITKNGGLKALGTKKTWRKIHHRKLDNNNIQVLSDLAGERGYIDIIELLKDKYDVEPKEIKTIIDDEDYIDDSPFKIEDGVVKGYFGDEENVIIPKGVRKIGYEAFAYSSIISITIPDGVTVIDESAFSSGSLEKIFFPKKMKKICEDAFSCTEIKEILLPKGLRTISEATFFRCRSLESVTLPKGVKTICGAAFSECTSLSNVVIPEGVTTIESYAFSDCINLSKIVIPESVTSIENYAFDNCINLTEVVLPNKEDYITSYAFRGCKNISDQELFSIMNIILKGTAVAINTALKTFDTEYFIPECFSYNPNIIDVTDTKIIEVGVVFTFTNQKFFTKDELPISSIPNIKFIGLGDGSNGLCATGSYVFFKDFEETKISNCYLFSEVSPHMEEFETQLDVVNRVNNSFMNHEWEYEYKKSKYHGAKATWKFKGKKAKELIKMWENDKK